MKHASSRKLYHYWATLRGQRPAPKRDEIDPVALRRVLGDSFILSVEPALGHRVRLAGTRVCALFRREIKTASFLDLWASESRALMSSLVEIVTGELSAVVAGVQGQAKSEPPVPLELLLLPLAPGATQHSRLIGILAPLVPVYWIGINPVETLTLGAFRHIEPVSADAVPARAATPVYPGPPLLGLKMRQNPPHLVVYEGGAARNPAGADRSLSDQ